MSLRFLKNLPLQLFLSLILGLFLGKILDNKTISYIYTASLIIKDGLMTVLPFIIFSYLVAALVSFEKKAPLLIVFIVLLVVFSNAMSVIVAYGAAQLAFPFLGKMSAEGFSAAKETILPVWNIGLEPLISSDKALLAGIITGLMINFIPSESTRSKIKDLSFRFRDWTTKALKNSFIPFLPIYVLGFVLKLDKDSSIEILMQNYGKVFIVGCLLIVVYLLFLYGLAANFRKSIFIGYLREMIPAGLTGFSTMSSAATMPVTLAATERNLKDRSYADFVIPTTVNIHLVGDGLNIALTALALLVMSGQNFPSFNTYLLFTLYYCLAKFSCAGIPGGGVIVILPVIQSYLGLSSEITGLLATIYILQDPILTSANVMGNGAFALLSRKILNLFSFR